MGYKSNTVSNRPQTSVVRQIRNGLKNPFQKGFAGSLDHRIYPGTSAWKQYEATGVQAEDAPHAACNGDIFADYFGEPAYESVKLFEKELPNWVFSPQLLVSKWVYSAEPVPVMEGEIESFEKRLSQFITRNKLPNTLRPGVVHFELQHLKATFHGYCPQTKVLIHVDSADAPRDDGNYWLWQMTSMAYKLALFSHCGFDVERVVFGDVKFSRDISGDRLKTLYKMGATTLHLLNECYQEFVVEEEEPPFA
jgi:hypothetical protein